MKKIVTMIVFVAATFTMSAQEYKTGIGFRLDGFNSGITIKHFTGSTTALEGIVGFGRHALTITGLYEKHQNFPNAEGLSWFYGGGAHVGFYPTDYSYGYYRYYNNKNKVYYYNDNYYNSTFSLGADFILGLEYKFQNAPITIGLDAKPFVDIVPGFFGYFTGGFSFRFTL